LHYEEATDHYRCPQGKRVRRIAKKLIKMVWGKEYVWPRSKIVSVVPYIYGV
jgi:hypothetical protein